MNPLEPTGVASEVFIVETDAEIEGCFPVFKTLRPHLEQGGFLAQVRRQQKECYQILALKHDGVIKSVAGFRLAEFLAWGKVLYIDDLATLPGETSQGFAGALLDWLIAYAKAKGCQGVHLDTGYARHAAHRLYLRKGLQLNCHHLMLELK
jgi:GNAT superfamily N-acetyltransferase